jgi:hypothetical protein
MTAAVVQRRIIPPRSFLYRLPPICPPVPETVAQTFQFAPVPASGCLRKSEQAGKFALQLYHRYSFYSRRRFVTLLRLNRTFINHIHQQVSHRRRIYDHWIAQRD